MKSILSILLLISSMTYGQMLPDTVFVGTLMNSGDLLYRVKDISKSDTLLKYDTVKVIAEVYQLSSDTIRLSYAIMRGNGLYLEDSIRLNDRITSKKIKGYIVYEKEITRLYHDPNYMKPDGSTTLMNRWWYYDYRRNGKKTYLDINKQPLKNVLQSWEINW